MDLFLYGLLALGGGGVLALLLAAFVGDRAAIAAGTLAVLAGSGLGLVPAVQVLLGSSPPLAFHAAWSVPGGSLSFLIDRLAAFFLVTVLGLASAAAVYGAGYLDHYRGKKALGPVLLFFNLLVVSLASVVTARNGVLFLVAWELMTLFAFLLVSFEDEREEVRRAALLYIVVSHIATSFLVAFFLLLGREAGSLDFERFAAIGKLPRSLAGALFAFALVGFGTKAGAWPLHIWLPEAHPAAPTHVSAIMSGVIVKVAVYGLVRGLGFLGKIPPSWAYAIVLIGAVSGVIGVLYALAQHDLKRLLAYHTIENIGIILMGLGTGFLGLAYGSRTVALLGFAGGLLHVLNHGVFKSLLFFGAGSVLQATHARDVERLGGLARAMPWTATTFLVASVAISGLPPLNGFVSEWLVYSGFFRAALDLPAWGALGELAAVAALAAIGGLAAACFAKAFGVVFLGSARTEDATHARECRPSMRAAMVALAVVCLAIGLRPDLAGRVVLPVAADLAGVAAPDAAALADPVVATLGAVARTGAVFAGTLLALALVRAALLRGRPVEEGRTWGCGYGSPTARMQYTASSFADPLLKLAQPVLRPAVHDEAPEGYFPRAASRSTHTADLADERVLRPAALAVARGLASLHWLQQGRIQLYLLYILVAVVALLLWQLIATGGG